VPLGGGECSVGKARDPEDRQRREQHNWEVLKLYFEFFKHFTTLTSAIALLVIALQRALGLGAGAAIAVLVLLGINLLLCLSGMYVVMFRANDWGYSPSPGSVPFWLMVGTILAFVFGLIVILAASTPVDTSGCLFPSDYLFNPEDC
jgi:hypothetical protein